MTEPIGNVKLRPLPPGQRHCQSIGARVAWEWFFFEQRESRYCCRIEGCAASFCMSRPTTTSSAIFVNMESPKPITECCKGYPWSHSQQLLEQVQPRSTQ